MAMSMKGWGASKKLRAGGNTKMSFQKEFPESGPYTVQFNISGPGGPEIPNPTAVVTWKVNGNPVQRRLSLVDGTTISGTAEAVEVEIEDDSEAITGFVYTVTIVLAKGTRPSNVVPPTYLPILPTGSPGRFFVNSGIPVDIAIPDNSGFTSLFVTAGATVPAVLDEADLAVQQANQITILKTYDPRAAGWVPLSPSANKITLINNSGAGLLFGVTFGVDG